MSKTKLSVTKALLLAALVSFLQIAAKADSAYIATVNGSFGILDFGAHTYTVVGTTSAVYSGLGFDASHNLYSVESSTSRFFKVNPANGSGSVVGVGTGVRNWVMAGLTSGALYEIDYTSTLFSLNPSTGAATSLGTIGVPAPSGTDAGGLTGTGNTLYYAFNDSGLGANSVLFKINPQTCCAAQRVGTDTGVASIGALVFVNGTLYGFDNVAKNVLKIDTNTGGATVLFPFPGLLASDKVVGAAAPPTGTAMLPHFATGGGFVTAFYVVNSSSQPANFSISFYDDSGKPVSLAFAGLSTIPTLSDTIVGNGAKYYEAGTASATLASGSGVITADASITIQALFRRLGADNSYYEAAVPSTAGNFEFQVPFDATTLAANGAAIFTGIAVGNLDPVNSANVVCTVRDALGNVIPNAVSVPTLSPFGHWANYLFPALTGQRGTFDCTSSTKIGAIGLRALGNNAISSLPIIPIR